ncbi:nucleotidyl transferase AbiEii/AbiGii toxin family protein [Corallococcus terminator]
MSTRRYLTGGAFKNALEQRLRKASKHGDDFSRRRQLLVFHRFLARAAQTFGDAVTLKGGLVLELRLERARTTRDVDLRLTGSPRDLLERLQQAGQLDLGDFMRFELRLDTSHPEIQTEGLRYDGRRFRAACRIERELFSQPFGVDVAFGDPLLGEPDVLDAEDGLGEAVRGFLDPVLLEDHDATWSPQAWAWRHRK